MSTHFSVERWTQVHEPHIRLFFLKKYGVPAPPSLSYLYRNIEGSPRSTTPLLPGHINGVSVVLNDQLAPIEATPFMFLNRDVFFAHLNGTWNDTQKRVIFWWYPPLQQEVLSQRSTVNLTQSTDGIDPFVYTLAANLPGGPHRRQSKSLQRLDPGDVEKELTRMEAEQQLNQLIDTELDGHGSFDPDAFGVK